MEKLPRPETGPKWIFQTPHFGLLPAKLEEKGPLKFCILDKQYGVLYGAAGNLGVARLAMAIAEGEYDEAMQRAAEAEARNYKIDGTGPPNLSGIN